MQSKEENANMIQIAQTTKPALTTFALILATTIRVEKVQYARPATTGPFAGALKTGAATRTKSAFNVGTFGFYKEQATFQHT